MIKDMSLEEFLNRNHINNETWEKAHIDWPTLQAIAFDHEAESANLESSAELFAKVIQKFDGVHSVRWRVKKSEHLVEKIIRKKSEGNPKYSDITKENYFECVTDLIGVRALHLFKEDCFAIDTSLKVVWNPIEATVAYIRQGDSDDLKRRFEEEGFEVRNHPAGYRSVHYVIESIPLKRKIIAEIQVRTIFEEGWSEIDHVVRYPNFSDNKLVQYFLEIFNRMAGSADDMGGFVLGLVATINQLETEIIVAKEEKAAIFQDMEIAVSQLENVKEQDKASKQSIAQLKLEIAKLKEANHAELTSGLLASNTVGKASQSLSDLIKLGGLNQARIDTLQAGFKDVFKNSAAEYASRGLADLWKSSAVNPVSHGLLDADLSEVLTNRAKEQARRRLIGSIKTASIEKAVSGIPKKEEDPPL